MKEEIVVRPARNSDREAVFKFCEKTWSWGDYIPQFWDKWMKETDGKIFVATISSVPVGMSHVRVDKRKKEAWLSAARTAPEHRRKGIATAIAKECMKYAKRNGAVKARLVTSSDNKAARIVLQKLGFTPIAEFVEMKTEKIRRLDSLKSRWGRAEDLNALWKFLQESNIFQRSAGLYTILFRWYSLTREDLERFLREKKAIVYEGNAQIQGLILIDDSTARMWQENTLQTCYVDGSREAIIDMLSFLLTRCFEAGTRKVYGFACNDESLVSAMKEIGFEAPEGVEIVYEKEL
ncbi:MAG TPA: GNAT family N-acetyltransferase [Candidatus Bathyarchaeota archaeon]|nr:GNAT family N-acetyltransferase [Candidatus Bathyarchaeota archaeon]